MSDETLEDVITEAIELLTAFTIPLYLDIDKHPTLHGTGFFVKANDEYFLVSAAHVFDTAMTEELAFYVSPNVTRRLTGKLVRSGPPASRAEDMIDIGVLKLSDDPIPPYRDVNKIAMDVSYLVPELEPREGKNYVIIGFPETKNRAQYNDKAIVAAPYAYRSDSASAEIYRVNDVSTKNHVVLPLNLKKQIDPHGRRQHFPKPQGMSGSPIVVLYDTDNLKDFRVFPVVAVGTTYRRQKNSLIGTDVRYVLDAIGRAA